jgi:hypothetical protein
VNVPPYTVLLVNSVAVTLVADWPVVSITRTNPSKPRHIRARPMWREVCLINGPSHGSSSL